MLKTATSSSARPLSNYTFGDTVVKPALPVEQSPEDAAKEAIREVADLKSVISELLEWKRRQDEKEAERLTAIRNDVLEVLLVHKATMIEIQTILKMLDIETVSTFIASQKSKASGGAIILSAKAPTTISGSKE